MVPFKKFENSKRDEQGAALMGVVLISTFVFTVMLSLAGTTLVGTTLTANSGSSIKAFAAAEAGRDTQLTELSKGVCAPIGSVSASSSTPAYSWRIYHSSSESLVPPNSTTQTGVSAGCPSASSTYVLIQTTGTDVKGASKTILSTYKWTSTVSSAPGETFEAAVASGNRLVLSNLKITLPPGAPYTADIVVKSGNFKCEGSGNQVAGSVYVLNGNTEDMNGCGTIEKDLLNRGNVTVNKYGRAVDGRICATGLISNYYQYSWTAPRDYPAGGGAQQYQSAAACGLNDVDGWVDYSPPTSAVPGWAYVQLGSSPYCRNDSNYGQPNVYRNGGFLAYYLRNLTTPTIVDMQGCGKVEMNNVGGPNLAIKTSITLVAGSYGLENFNVTSANGGSHQFNIITPDKIKNATATPNCGSGQGEYRSVQVTTVAPITGMIYSPCNTSQYVGNWRGQIYLGGVNSNMANSTILYIPQTVPGESSSGGSGGPSESKASTILLSQTEPS